MNTAMQLTASQILSISSSVKAATRVRRETPTYKAEKPCKRCGGIIRYCNNRCCVTCHKLHGKKRKQKG